MSVTVLTGGELGRYDSEEVVIGEENKEEDEEEVGRTLLLQICAKSREEVIFDETRCNTKGRVKESLN